MGQGIPTVKPLTNSGRKTTLLVQTKTGRRLKSQTGSRSKLKTEGLLEVSIEAIPLPQDQRAQTKKSLEITV